MAIDIKIHIDLSPRQKRIIRSAVVLGSVVGALGIGLAFAAPIDTTWVVDGGPLTASSLKGNLDGLQAQLSTGRFVLTNGSVQYSVGATRYCGTGPTETNGAISYNGQNGYAGAKAMCQASTGCGNSLTAHMCTPEEMTRSAQLGIATPSANAWISSGFSVASPNPPTNNDCSGWTNNTTSFIGPDWTGAPEGNYCDNTFPIACCD